MGTIDPTLLQQAIYDASQAGFSGDNLVRIVSIGAAESSGFTNSNPNTSPAARCNEGGCPTGILQIKPGYWAGTAGCNDVNDWLCAFKTAIHIINTQGWQAWETFTVGNYRQYEPEVRAALNSYGIPASSPGVVVSAPGQDLSSPAQVGTTLGYSGPGSSVVDALDFLHDPVGTLRKSFQTPFENIAVFLFGLVAIVGGVMIMSSSARGATVTLVKEGAKSAAA